MRPSAWGRRLGVCLAVAAIAGACQAAAPTPSPSATPVPSVPASPSQAASPSHAIPLDPASLDGIWVGDLTYDGGGNPLTVRLEGCAVGKACGENEYADPALPQTPFCAAELTLEEARPDALVLKERMTFRPWNCFPGTLVLTPGDDGTLAIESFGDLAQPPCCTGTLTRAGPLPSPTPVPLAGPVQGLGTPTAALDLRSTTTQYTAEGFGSLWLPGDTTGEVIRVDAATGAEQARIGGLGDPGAVQLQTDPHGVAAADDGVWVAAAAAHALVLIDPATNAVTRRIAIDVEPYVLAIDGRRAWVTSFMNDSLVEVDLDTGRVRRTVAVAKPTGVAIGAGAVWVVEHRANTLVRVDPSSGESLTRIVLGEERPYDLCGMCVENVVVAEGAVWTSDNHGRSVTRVDPMRNRVAERIELPLRVWAVTASDGRVWASQFEEDVLETDPDAAGLTAAIDPRTNEATTYGLPSYSVAWVGDALWVTQRARRSDILVRVALEP